MPKPNKAILSTEDEANARESFRALDKVNRYWDRHAPEIQEKYGGQWVAFLGDKVIAHSRNAERLRTQLDNLGPERDRIVLRYVPAPDTEFVF